MVPPCIFGLPGYDAQPLYGSQAVDYYVSYVKKIVG